MGTRSLGGAAKVSVELNLVHLHETVHLLCSWGWWVFPLAEGKKTPVTGHGHKDATTDISVALRLFNNDQLNIGISTGPSRLVVLDGDGEAGNVWLADAHETYGIPPTFTVRTRAGGFHYYFEAPTGIDIRCSASRIAPEIDIRATGGYVVGPTSWVAADEKGPAGSYKLIDDSPVAPLPEWLFHLILATQARAPRNSTSRPCSLKRAQPETPRAVATLKEVLKHIDADCDYETYRAVIWAVISTGWRCAEQVALDWSLTAPERFEQSTFEALVNTYDPDRPDCISYGTLIFFARQGGYRG